MKLDGIETEEYKAFVDKFKPKLTTDDCATPEGVYEIVKNWAVEKYGLQGRPIVRPFWPGKDYQKCEYPDGCVVLDNPPFSIMSKIVEFYRERGIDFFLFAHSLTLFSSAKALCNAVIASAPVVYKNGARVATSFLTNLGEYLVETAPDLRELLDNYEKGRRHKQAKYEYPANLITAARLNKAVNLGVHFTCKHAVHIGRLDSQRPKKKAVYGGGYLISDRDAEMLRAEMLRAEMLRAEMPSTVWTVSDRERLIIDGLSRQGAASDG